MHDVPTRHRSPRRPRRLATAVRRGTAIAMAWLALMAAPPTMAFQTVLEDRYVLHDELSVSEARQLLHSRLREEGARQAGSYVARETTLTAAGDLEESVTVLTSAMIESETLDEQLTVNAQGHPVLALRVRLSVDDSQLERRIEALYEDHAQQLALDRLSRENRRLQQELRDIIATRNKEGAGASRRARQAERLLVSLSDNRRAVAELFDPQALGEAIDASLERRSVRQQRLLADGASLARSLQERMQVAIDHVTHRGEWLQLEVRVSGLGDYRRELAQLVGIPFDRNGMIDQHDLREMSRQDRDRFFDVFEILASFPFFVKVEASQSGMHDGRFAAASQLLLGTAWVRPGRGGDTVSSAAVVKPDHAADIVERSTLPRGMAVALVHDPTDEAIRVAPNGDLRFTLQLAAEGGTPERLEAKVLQLPWNFYRNVKG